MSNVFRFQLSSTFRHWTIRKFGTNATLKIIRSSKPVTEGRSALLDLHDQESCKDNVYHKFAGTFPMLPAGTGTSNIQRGEAVESVSLQRSDGT